MNALARREAGVAGAAPERERRLANPIEVLTVRAWARAWLWSTCDILDLLDAIDPLQTYAEQSGLVDTIGQDAVQAVIGGAFRAVRPC